MAEISVSELSADLRKAIATLENHEGLEKAGVVIRVGDGVAWVHGLQRKVMLRHLRLILWKMRLALCFLVMKIM